MPVPVPVREKTEDAGMKIGASVSGCASLKSCSCRTETFFFVVVMSADITIPRFIGANTRFQRPYLLRWNDCPNERSGGVGHDGQTTMRMMCAHMEMCLLGYGIGPGKVSECSRSRQPEANAIHFLIGSNGPNQVQANLILCV